MTQKVQVAENPRDPFLEFYKRVIPKKTLPEWEEGKLYTHALIRRMFNGKLCIWNYEANWKPKLHGGYRVYLTMEDLLNDFEVK